MAPRSVPTTLATPGNKGQARARAHSGGGTNIYAPGLGASAKGPRAGKLGKRGVSVKTAQGGASGTHRGGAPSPRRVNTRP